MYPIYKIDSSISNLKFELKKCSQPSDWQLKNEGDHRGKGPFWGSYFLHNYQYRDLRGRSMKSAGDVIKREIHALRGIIEKATNLMEFEILCDATKSKDFSEEVPELGVIGISAVISAMGGAPITACRAHGFMAKTMGSEPQPTMGFFCNERIASKIKEIIDILVEAKECPNLKIVTTVPHHSDPYKWRAFLIVSDLIQDMSILAMNLYLSLSGEAL